MCDLEMNGDVVKTGKRLLFLVEKRTENMKVIEPEKEGRRMNNLGSRIQVTVVGPGFKLV